MEKTYSAPFAAHLYAREMVELPDGGQTREFPRLKYGGAHLQNPETQLVPDVASRAAAGAGAGMLVWSLLIALLAARLARQRNETFMSALVAIWRRTTRPLVCHLHYSCVDTITERRSTGVMRQLPYLRHRQGGAGRFLSVAEKHSHRACDRHAYHINDAAFCVAPGHHRRIFPCWVDDVIQYLYTTLSSIPSVLLIAAAVLMMQVYIETRPELFDTVAARADLRLLFLCVIRGDKLDRFMSLAAWRNPETEGDGVYSSGPCFRGVSLANYQPSHTSKRDAHRVDINRDGFQRSRPAEAVLSYVGVGVDPSMISFGTMINAARMEMAREPMCGGHYSRRSVSCSHWY